MKSRWYRSEKLCGTKRSEKAKKEQNKLASEWEQGLWLGHCRWSNEVVIGTDDGVVKAYTVERKMPGERWDGERVKKMQGTLNSLTPRSRAKRYPLE